jgi:hypothetical protein
MKVSRISVVIAAMLLLSLTVVLAAQAGQAPGGAGAGQGGGGGRGGRGAAAPAPATPPAAGAPAAGGAQGGGGRGGGGRGGANAAPPAPAPRWPDGKIRLGATPGQKGLWYGAFGGGTVQGGGGQPLLPWAASVLQDRRVNQLEPHARCKPSGVVRQFQTPYGVDIVELPEQKVIYIMDVGGPHTFRTIYMDGREHPKDYIPTAYGHSVGRWEGDTLVVDTVGFNEKFWIDRVGSPHTEKMQVVEKFTRTSMTAMRHEYTVTDPMTYTASWTAASDMRFAPGDELFEYICQDNNFGAELMVGAGTSVDRSSTIVP